MLIQLPFHSEVSTLGNGPVSDPGGPPTAPTSLRVSPAATYHPGLAAEVVDGVEGIDSGQPSVLQADDQAAVVFAQGHAVGVLADQEEVGLEGPAREGPTAALLRCALRERHASATARWESTEPVCGHCPGALRSRWDGVVGVGEEGQLQTQGKMTENNFHFLSASLSFYFS